MLRGAGKVGSALIVTQGEQLRLMTCNSTLGAGVQAAQGVVEGLVSTFMGGSNAVSFWNAWNFNVHHDLFRKSFIHSESMGK